MATTSQAMSVVLAVILAIPGEPEANRTIYV